ncbi:MAG: hypothetical protein H0W72_02795 [Planctomycetes bacterium]|nr:hypothetical protein [Planctomycetota bacterium]
MPILAAPAEGDHDFLLGSGLLVSGAYLAAFAIGPVAVASPIESAPSDPCCSMT